MSPCPTSFLTCSCCCGFCDMPHQSIAILLSLVFGPRCGDAAWQGYSSPVRSFTSHVDCDAPTPAPAGKLNRLLGGPAADAVACWQHFGPNFAYINIYEFIKSEPHTLARSFARRGKLAADWMDECISQLLTSAVGKGYVHWAKIYRFVIITFIISHSISSPNKLYSLFNKIRLFSTKWCWYNRHVLI